jgi:hypothetical protein
MPARPERDAARQAGPGTPGSEPGHGVSEWQGMQVLVSVGLIFAALLAGFVVLYANVPAGFDALYGLSLESPGLFRALWPYPTFALDSGVFGRLAALLIVALWAIYLGAWAIVGSCSLPATRRRLILVVAAFTLVFHLALTLFMPTVLSTDIFHYALFGRLVAFYDLNPYIVPGTAISPDMFWPFAGWRDVTTHYGPVWTLISAGLAVTGDQSVLVTVLGFKSVAALFSLANCLLVFLLSRRLTGGDGLSALLLYAWNPLILIETAGSGHNDAVMMTFALLGLLLAARGRLVLGLVALLLSMMVKYLTALLVLFYVVHCLANQTSRQRMLNLAAQMCGVGVILVGFLYLPFWAGPASLDRLVSVGAPFKSLVRVFLGERLTGLLANGDNLASLRATAESLVILGLHLAFSVFLVLLMRASVTRPSNWPRVLTLWGLASLVYVCVIYGWNLPWLIIPTLTTACVAVQTRWQVRLLSLSHALGCLLMLPYALLIKV